MNAYKYFHISNKDLRNNLVLKDKNAQHWKSFSYSSQISLMSLWQFLKNPSPIEDFNSLGCFLHNLKTLILKIIVFLWIPNSVESLINFPFSINFLKTYPW